MDIVLLTLSAILIALGSFIAYKYKTYDQYVCKTEQYRGKKK